MADRSKIEWTDATWNVITGCSVVSPGCTGCYAMRLAGTRLRNHPSREGLTEDSKAGPVWNGRVRFNEQWLDQPLRWRRPRMIFPGAHGDLFHENVWDSWLLKIFKVMYEAEQHTFQVLTKRPNLMAAFIRRHSLYPAPHIWLGFSAEDQRRFDERWPHVAGLADKEWLTWLSAEPLLGPLEVSEALGSGLAWVVAGGESGPGARPSHLDWFRTIRDDCERAEVPFHFKQFGDWLPIDSGHPGLEGPGFGRFDHCPTNEPYSPTHVRVGKKRAGRLLDGRTWDEMPEPRP